MTNNIRYSYLTDPENSRRVITFARTYNKDTGEIRYAFAVCRPVEKKRLDTPGDMFIKETGRLIASGRLHKKPYTLRVATTGCKPLPLQEVYTNIISNPDIPMFIRKIVDVNLSYTKCKRETRATIPRMSTRYSFTPPEGA